MNRSDLERHVRRLEWPELPADLRARVMAASRDAVEPVTWSDRIWFSRGWRIAAAAAFAAVIVAGPFIDGSGSGPFAPTPQALANAEAIEATVREAGLPADVAATLARRAIGDRRGGSGDEERRLALQMFNIEGDRR